MDPYLMTKRNRTTSSLLHLPYELRNQIYSYVYCAQFFTKDEGPPPKIYCRQKNWPFIPKVLALSQVCQQLRDESDLQKLTLGLLEDDGQNLWNMLVVVPRQSGVTSVNWIKRLPIV